MIVTIVQVKVKPECVEAFKRECLENHRRSVMEEGNARFDVLQEDGNPASFVLYEAYSSKERAAAHKQTPHYSTWRDAVAGMMAEPRRGTPFTAVAPE